LCQGRTDICALVHERFPPVDEKLDKLLDGVAELRQMLSGAVETLASQDQRMVAIDVRLGRIEKRLELRTPTISD
jgi:hypothetical protein